LHINHFLVLDALLLEAFGLSRVTLCLRLLIVIDGCALVFSHFGVALGPLAVLSLLLRDVLIFLLPRLLVAHAHLHDFDSLLLRLLDFLPRLRSTSHDKIIAPHRWSSAYDGHGLQSLSTKSY
jgi:hypothetical protein